MLSAVISDLHKFRGSLSICDEAKVDRFVETAIQRRFLEVLVAGDAADVTRDGDDGIPQMAEYLTERIFNPLGRAGIRSTYLRGNHEGIGDSWEKLIAAILPRITSPLLFSMSTGPEFRGRVCIEHGHRFGDPWNAPGSPLTPFGEAFTKLDFWADHLGIDLEAINPTTSDPNTGIPEMDWPVHKAANAYIAALGGTLIIGHSHLPYELHGACGGRSWDSLNCGSFVKGTPFSFAWFGDDGVCGVEVERIL